MTASIVPLKRCTKCGQEFPATPEYFPRRKHGLKPRCKTCHREDCQIYKARPEVQARMESEEYKQYISQMNRDWNASEQGKQYRLTYNHHYRKTFKGRQSAIETSRKQRQNNPARIKATREVNHAVRSGKLPHISTLTCQDCGKPAEQYHHYLGYEPEHWFDVIPLCLKCHQLAHRESSNP